MTDAFDVVVVGGGTAGIGAALGAARSGARTLLVERHGMLGGMATAGMVSTLCGLYHTRRDGPPALLNDGVAREVVEALVACVGSRGPVRQGRTFVVPYAPPAFALVADALVGAAASLTVRLHTTCTGVVRDGDRVRALHLLGADGPFTVTANAVVDTTGDAVVALLAGAATDTPPPWQRQLPSLVLVLQHVDTAALDATGGSVGLLRALDAAERSGALPPGTAHVSLRRGLHPGELVVKLALDHVPAAPDDLTAAETIARRRAAALAAHLHGQVPAFRDAFVSHHAPQIGVRERRRIVGRYTLTRDDVLEARRFPDAVAQAAWPIERWEPGRVGATYEYLTDGAAYDVPAGCLVATAPANLFAAGRCMSASHAAIASARVMGTCLAVGEAAGRLAAASAST